MQNYEPKPTTPNTHTHTNTGMRKKTHSTQTIATNKGRERASKHCKDNNRNNLIANATRFLWAGSASPHRRTCPESAWEWKWWKRKLSPTRSLLRPSSELIPSQPKTVRHPLQRHPVGSEWVRGITVHFRTRCALLDREGGGKEKGKGCAYRTSVSSSCVSSQVPIIISTFIFPPFYQPHTHPYTLTSKVCPQLMSRSGRKF